MSCYYAFCIILPIALRAFWLAPAKKLLGIGWATSGCGVSAYASMPLVWSISMTDLFCLVSSSLLSCRSEGFLLILCWSKLMSLTSSSLELLIESKLTSSKRVCSVELKLFYCYMGAMFLPTTSLGYWNILWGLLAEIGPWWMSFWGSNDLRDCCMLKCGGK